MKFIALLLSAVWMMPIQAKVVQCAVPKILHKQINTLFQKKIEYTKLQVHIVSYADNRKALEALREGKAKFAVIRSDILWMLHAHSLQWEDLSMQYITLAILPYRAQLFLVRPRDDGDIDINSLKRKLVSIGSIGEANGHLLKSILALTDIQYQVSYRSIPLHTSLKAIKSNELDAFFGFLPSSYENTDFHFQTLFSDQTTEYLHSQLMYHADYNGVYTPYLLIAANDATDEEIENMIYRLEEKGLFSPQTDERYGELNLYLLQHLEQIKLALDARVAVESSTQSNYTPHILSQSCLAYHYGFLDLLRRKPRLKKKVWRTGKKRAKGYLRDIEHILLAIDAKKHTCDHAFLHDQTEAFKRVERNINTLGR